MDIHIHDRFQGHRELRRGRVSLPGQVYHVTTGTRGQQAWFSDFHVACEAVRAFRQPAALGDAGLLAWVLMPDHVHWLLQLGGRMPLEMVVARMKGISATRVNRVLFRAGPLWAPAFHDRALHREDDVRAVARHIVAHPLRARLVDHMADYPFWDSTWLL